MRRPRTPVRTPDRAALLGLPAAAALVLALGACHHAAPAGDPTPAPVTSSPSATSGLPQGPAPTAQSPRSTVAAGAGSTGGTGSDGLTVRYLAPDGSERTLGVEDFPR